MRWRDKLLLRNAAAYYGSLLIAVVLSVLIAKGCSARTIWQDGGFLLESAGWVNDARFRDWTGIRCGITLPDDGWMWIKGKGAIEVFLPCKNKWVTDIGIVVSRSCDMTMETTADTRGGDAVLTAEDRCRKHGDRVLIMIMVPKLLGTSGCNPTEARWVRTKVDYDAED